MDANKELPLQQFKEQLTQHLEINNNQNNYQIKDNLVYFRNDLLISTVVYQCVRCIRIFNTITDSHIHYKQFHQNINDVIDENHDCHVDNNVGNASPPIKNNFVKSNCLVTNSMNENENKSKNVDKKCSKIKLKTTKRIKTNEFEDELRENRETVVKQSINRELKEFECDLCHNKYKNLSSYQRHQQLHKNPRICCFKDCNKSFATNRELKSHELTHNAENQEFKCELCDRKYKRMSSLNVHKRVHTNPCVCHICGKYFSINSQLKIHQLSHSDECPLACDWPGCDFRAKQTAGIWAHKRSVHSNERPFKCDWIGCSHTFKASSALREHISSVHKLERNYKCEWPACEKRYASESRLKYHRLSHTGERPYLCDWPNCGQRFANKEVEKRHRLTHTGEKPYRCDWPGCGARFRANATLGTHKKLVHKCDYIRRSRWDNKNKVSDKK